MSVSFARANPLSPLQHCAPGGGGGGRKLELRETSIVAARPRSARPQDRTSVYFASTGPPGVSKQNLRRRAPLACVLPFLPPCSGESSPSSLPAWLAACGHGWLPGCRHACLAACLAAWPAWSAWLPPWPASQRPETCCAFVVTRGHLWMLVQKLVVFSWLLVDTRYNCGSNQSYQSKNVTRVRG